MTSEFPNPKTVAELIQEIHDASTEYIEAKQNSRMARSRESSALIRLTDAQQAFDKAITDIHRNAPEGSEWQRKTLNSQELMRRAVTVTSALDD